MHYATLAVLYTTGTFYVRYFGAYLPLCLNIIILLREDYTPIMHMSGIKASLYDTQNKHKDGFLCRELAALNAMGGAEHAQRILLSGVKASLYDTKQIQGCMSLSAALKLTR